MSDFIRQLGFAARGLRRHPGFALVAVLTLGLGIGAATSVFSVVDAVLLRGLPFHEPDQLVRLISNNPARGIDRFGSSPLDFLDWRKDSKSFAQVVAWAAGNATLAGGPGVEAARLDAEYVTEDFFALLGVNPPRGRPLLASDYTGGQGQVVVISDALWRSRFGADPGVVGRAVEIDGHAREIVGVMAPGFRFPNAYAAVDVWLPYIFGPDDLHSRGARWLSVAGRLRPGVPLAGAQAEMTALAARLEQFDPAHNGGWKIAVMSLQEATVGATRKSLLMLFGAVALLLLIACFNVASLLAARAFARRGEIALRAALGGGTRRLLAPLAAEGLVLALAGGAFGLLCARWCRDGLLWLAGGQLPQLNSPDLDMPLLVGALAFAILAGVLCSVLPALPVVRGAALEIRRESSGSRRTASIRRVLVVSEVALTLVLLAGAGLMARTLFNLLGQDAGVRTANVLTFNLVLPDSSYAKAADQGRFFDALLTQLAAVPGVINAGATNVLPLSGNDWSISFDRVDRPKSEMDQDSAEYRVITPGLLPSLGVAMRRGRGLAAEDRVGVPLVVLVSETFAKRYYGGEDPLGKQIKIGDRTPDPRTIVGVVADVREDLATPAPPMYYVAAAQHPLDAMVITLHTDPAVASTTAVLEAARDVVARLDRNLPVYGVVSFEQVRRESLGRRRLSALLLGAFAGAALLLAVVGLYGLMSFQVSQRSGEFGVRAALGARRVDLLRMVLGQGLRLTALGVALGVGAALLLGRVLAGMLFGVTASDPLTLVAVASLLLLAAAVGCWLPARRASRLDPMSALREE
ncbi:MAG: ABC transporter permease [Acidobacteriota bacterium]